MYGPTPHQWMMFDGQFGVVFGVIWMILAWGIPILVFFALLKYLFTNPHRRPSREAAPERVVPVVSQEPKIPADLRIPEPTPPLSDEAAVTEPKTPLDLLKEAYARGDITRGEYLQKRDDLLE